MLRGSWLASVQPLAFDEIEARRRSWRALRTHEAEIKIDGNRHEHHCISIGRLHVPAKQNAE